ncbi:MAG: septum formation initiator family protein [Patescibacteria group bacterium]
MKIQEKDNTSVYKTLLKSRIFLIFLAPVFLTLLFGVFQNLYYRLAVKGDLDKLNNEIAVLIKQKEDLNKLLEYYQSQANLVKEARVRLNMKKEGEEVVIILPQATSTGEGGETISGPGGAGGEGLPNYLQWWYHFFGK